MVTESLLFKLTHECSRLQSLIYFHCFSEKIRLDISCESSARQRIHMKHQALFSSKDKSKQNKNVVCCNFSCLQNMFSLFFWEK